jgi:acylpyruvate hydrolase
MRLVTFTDQEALRLGALVDDNVVDLSLASELKPGSQVLPRGMRPFLSLGPLGQEIAAASLDATLTIGVDDALERGLALPVAQVTLLPPVPDPTKIICVGRNYGDHAAETGADRPERAIFFTRFPQTLVGPSEDIWLPRASKELDWEGELAVVIGSTAKHVEADDAHSIVAGFSIFNDVSVRDFQLRTPQWTAGKNFDSSAPFGPAIVTLDELTDPDDLLIETLVNSEIMQSGRTADMIFSIPELIADISQWTTLYPGDVIATGTPAGVGSLRVPPRFLASGDVVEVRIDGLGQLRNQVADEPLLR